MPIETMMEGVAPSPIEEAPIEDAESTATLPLSIVGGKPVAVGDVLRLTVTLVDEDTIGVEYSKEAPATAPEKEGIEGMAAAFD